MSDVRHAIDIGRRPIARPVEREQDQFDWSEVLGTLPANASGSMAIGSSMSSALEALRANKLRAFLTMLGIIVGVGSVIIMAALGSGARASVEARLAGLGTNILMVQPGSANAGGVRTGTGGLPTLTEADAVAIQQTVPNVSGFTPMVGGDGIHVVAGNQNWSTRVQSYYPLIFQLQSWDIQSGQAFDDSDEQNAALVCDIGQTVATNLFGDADPVGEKILIRNVPFTVKGLFASKGSNGFQDQDDIILMPYSTANLRLFHLSYVPLVMIQVDDRQNIDTVLTAVTDLLRMRHHIRANQNDDFFVLNNTQIIQTAEQASNTLTYLLAGIAAVSLIVGGIGIMNIMLVSVTERTREIGIRMAIGARKSNVLSQFLIEAVLLSVVGGLIGIAIGFAGSELLSKLAGWKTLITMQTVAISFGFAALVGVFFGYYPARKASQLDPIEALRYE